VNSQEIANPGSPLTVSKKALANSAPRALYDSTVEVDSAVELGRDDPALELPWEDTEGTQRYFDLKRHPELLSDLPEAIDYPELREFLAVVNSPTCLLETAKCDAWFTQEMNPEEEFFEADWKCGSYVDLLFTDVAFRSSFEMQEKLVRDLSELLKKAPEIPASAEFMIRRCDYRAENPPDSDSFYITFYLFGYADVKELARQQWAIALKLVENAIRQIATRRDR
jgi:hypothetical protein